MLPTMTQVNPSSHSKNPRRVAAGRLNQLKSRGMTDAGRRRLSEAALRRKPWQDSTGPKTVGGKAASAQNGRYRQRGEVSRRQLRRELRDFTDMMPDMVRLRAAAMCCLSQTSDEM
jgi:hypothetical protein